MNNVKIKSVSPANVRVGKKWWTIPLWQCWVSLYLTDAQSSRRLFPPASVSMTMTQRTQREARLKKLLQNGHTPVCYPMSVFSTLWNPGTGWHVIFFTVWKVFQVIFHTMENRELQHESDISI